MSALAIALRRIVWQPLIYLDSKVPLRIFLAIYALNFFRIGYQTVAIAWFATLATSRINSVAELLLISSISTLCMSPIVGRLVDCVTRKKVLLCLAQACVVFSGVVTIGLFFLVPFVDRFIILSAFTVVLSGATLLAGGAMDYFLRTLIPDNVRGRQLALINAVTQIALIAGTCAAGVAASFVTIELGLLVLPLVASMTTVLCLIFLPDLRVASRAKTRKENSGYFSASIYFKFPFLFYFACTGAIVFSIGQVTNMLLPGLIAIHLKSGSIDYSATEAAWSIGAFGISVYLAAMKINLGRSITIDLLIVIAMSVLLAFVPFSPALSILVAMHFGLGIGFAFVRIRMETRFLQECPVHLLGRFRANSMALTSVVGLLIYFVPLVSRHATIASLYLSIAGVIFIVTMILLGTSASIMAAKSGAISE